VAEWHPVVAKIVSQSIVRVAEINIGGVIGPLVKTLNNFVVPRVVPANEIAIRSEKHA
jgi:hypothetical protein